MRRSPRNWSRFMRQFSLRVALLVMIATAVALAGWRAFLTPYQRQREILKIYQETKRPVAVRTESTLIPFLSWMAKLTDRNTFHEIIELDAVNIDFQPEHVRHLAALRSVRKLTLGGENFTIEHLKSLCTLPALQTLTLDSTSVRPADLNQVDKPAQLQIKLVQNRQMSAVRETLGQINDSFLSDSERKRMLRGIDQMTSQRRESMLYYLSNAGSYHYALSYPFSVDSENVLRVFRADSAEIAYKFRLLQPGPADLSALSRFYSLDSVDVRGALLNQNALRPLADLPVKELQAGHHPQWDEQQLDGIERLPHIEVLLIASCRLSDDGMRRLAPLSQIKTMWLPGTEITDEGLRHINAEKLESLDLSATRITDAGLAVIARFPRLRELCLENTQIGDVGLKHLRELTNLETLDLDGTNVSSAGLKELAHVKNLKRLSLARTHIEDVGLNYLRELTDLRVLDLSYTSTSKAASDELSTYLQNNPIIR